MEELFGVSMNLIAIVALVLTVAMLLFVGLIAVRNPVMFKMGLRNIPRRRAQTSLIIVGLMLSTLIVTAAFGTGDTISTSITADIFRASGEADEVIEWDTEKEPAPVGQQVIPLEVVDEWRVELADSAEIEALVPFLSELLPVVNADSGLNEPSARIVAFRSEDAEALGGLKDVDGDPVTVGPGEIAVNERLAELIDAEPGQTIVLFYRGVPLQLTINAIVRNEVLGGTFELETKQGAAVDYEVLSELTGKANVADAVFVSNTGDTKGGLAFTDAAMAQLEELTEGTPYTATPFKRDGVETAKFFGSLFVSFFVILGLFSIAAGVLLIFLIFVMLAAERQPEMGMARAVGAKRRQIVESFLAEGMGYDLGSAVVGVFAGMGATAAMIAILRAFLGDELGVTLDLSFSLRSLVVSLCLGLLATFIVIFVASWRASRLNIVAAIRDLPEASPANPEGATALGYLRAALNGLVMLALPLALVLLFLGPLGMLLAIPFGVLGVISPWLYFLRGSDFAQPRNVRTGEPFPKWPLVLGLLLLLAGVGLFILIGYGLASLLTRIIRDRRPERVSLGLLVAGVIFLPLGFVLSALQNPKARISWSAGIGAGLGLAGVLLVTVGVKAGLQFPFALGASLVCLFVATTLQYFRVAERAAFTLCSAALLAFWYLAPSGMLDWLTGELSGDVEMFFLSGFAMVAAGTFIIVYNADIILPAVGVVGGRYGRLVPALKTGIAYPLSARFRTGMTIAMIGLITFALVVNASLNANFLRLFLNEDTKGGWDIRVWVNSNNQVDDLQGVLADVPGGGTIEAIGEMRLAFPFEAEVENRDGYRQEEGVVPAFLRYPVLGVDNAFVESSDIKLKARAAGFGNEAEVWERLMSDPLAAVLPAAVSQEEGFGGDPELAELLHLDPIADGFEPFTLKLRAPDGLVTEVTVIGQMKESADQFWFGVMVPLDTLIAAFPESQGQQYFLQVGADTDAGALAQDIERTLIQASVDSLQGILDDQARVSNGFMLIFQGFMGLGLIVGIAALAVISFRSVVERRQQIGMLRAIGYRRGMVALSFMFESGFTAAAGISMGATLGLSLAWVLFTSGAIAEGTEGNGFAVPWLQLFIVTGGAFGAALLMTVIPARQAAGVPIAEALRYE